MLHVNEAGWPLNGHLTWATAAWWQESFQEVGFQRESESNAPCTEFTTVFEITAPARKSFFVFSKECPAARAEEIEGLVTREESRVLDPAKP